ncbi:MAG: PIG-L family deacetylase [Chloroflexi bacterium]|nr:PIG-L family deacetylase [Chloroflexota bacterium]
MSKQRTLLFVGAHPDDETFGIGSTLAQYATAGVKVYYACATRGEAGTVATELMRGYATIADLRWAELTCAAQVLGLTDVIYLGYRDSGMPGSVDNKHPEALIAAPLEQIAGRIVKVIRQLKPEVIITSDPSGGYGHPDHIAIHKATIKALQAAGDPEQYPEAGTAFQPQKLYFTVARYLRVLVKLAPFFGQNPRRFGRNKDIDLTKAAGVDLPVHASIRLTKQAIRTQDNASNCYVSQLAGGPPRAGLLGIIRRLLGRRSVFMRAYPPVNGRLHEKDLFEGVT